MKYSFEGRIRYSEIGENRRLTMPALVNYFQDCSTFQSQELKIGVDWLRERNSAWVLAAWQIHVKRYPAMGETVKTSTWSYGFKGFQGFRNFTMEDEQGEVIACANSVWVYMNLEDGRPRHLDLQEVQSYGITEAYPEDFGKRKITLPDMPGEAFESFRVMEYHLDTNHHVNNGQYLQMAQGYLPVDMEIKKLRAEYKIQAHLGDMLFPKRWKLEDGYLITLEDEDGKPYVIVEVK
ncbi:MAG: thioesterase [Lachnospiraceae bacterium]|nr:thioesterase [Lachnospiraceae bacterium]